MYISPISSLSLSRNYFSSEHKAKPKPLNVDKFERNNISFGNLQTSITEYADKNIKVLNELEQSFNTLMKELISDSGIEKNKYFSYFANMFKESGYRGLLENLRMPKSTPEINTLVEKSAQEGLVLAKSGDEPVLTLFNWGKHGFWQSSDSTRDMRILFSNMEKLEDKQAIIEYTIDKDGYYIIAQRVGKNYRETAFYSTTGNKRYDVYCYDGGKPDITYYNKDGSKSFWENWLHGGTQAEPIY